VSHGREKGTLKTGWRRLPQELEFRRRRETRGFRESDERFVDVQSETPA
jgi:hypothetical protein